MRHLITYSKFDRDFEVYVDGNDYHVVEPISRGRKVDLTKDDPLRCMFEVVVFVNHVLERGLHIKPNYVNNFLFNAPSSDRQ